MSIQTKKGFTLIELMVVIVIIGILAAIAIPKLFGMSAKAKASEVGPAAGTYIKMQMAYKVEKSEYGSDGAIGYILPGEKGKTTNFAYSVAATSNFDWQAQASFSADACGGTISTPWKVTVNENQFTATPGCEALTPTFDKISTSF